MTEEEENLLRKYLSMQTEYYINRITMYPGIAWKADFFTLEEFKENPRKLIKRRYKTPRVMQTVTSSNSVAKQSIKVCLYSLFCLHKGVPYNQVSLQAFFKG